MQNYEKKQVLFTKKITFFSTNAKLFSNEDFVSNPKGILIFPSPWENGGFCLPEVPLPCSYTPGLHIPYNIIRCCQKGGIDDQKEDVCHKVEKPLFSPLAAPLPLCRNASHTPTKRDPLAKTETGRPFSRLPPLRYPPPLRVQRAKPSTRHFL